MLFFKINACVRETYIKAVSEKLTDVNKTKGMYPAVKGKKRKLAEELANPENELSVTKLCEKFKISRTTFYNWQKEADFNGYIAYLIDSYTDSELANVWKALINYYFSIFLNILKPSFYSYRLYYYRQP